MIPSRAWKVRVTFGRSGVDKHQENVISLENGLEIA